MNKVILMGRLTKDPEVKRTPSNLEVCSVTIAVDRRFKDKDGTRKTDFINCVAWRQQATVLGNYFIKGSRIGIVGNIQTRNYDDQNGNKVYVTEVVVEEIEFVDSRKDTNTEAPVKAQEPEFEPVPVPPLPFANVDTGIEVDDDITKLPFDLTGGY